MITAPLRQKNTNKKGQMPMGNVSYSAHISNGKSAITSKKALAGVAKHNLRKYKSADYSSDNIRLYMEQQICFRMLSGYITENLMTW